VNNNEMPPLARVPLMCWNFLSFLFFNQYALTSIVIQFNWYPSEKGKGNINAMYVALLLQCYGRNNDDERHIWSL